jgi:GxxExxY protein
MNITLEEGQESPIERSNIPNQAVSRLPIPERLNEVSGQIVQAAVKIHKTLGPGLLEAAYEACMAREMALRNLKFRTQVPIPIEYESVKLDAGFRLDMLVEEQVIVELKAVEKVIPLHQAQLLTYLKLSKCRLGLLINFNSLRIMDDLVRLVN